MKRYTRKKNSTKVFVAVTAFAALVFGSTFYFFSTKNEVIVAKINNENIFKSEIERKLHSVFDSQDQEIKLPAIENLPPEVIKILAKEIYIEKELLKEAKKSDVVKSAEIKAKISDSESLIIRQAYLDSIIKGEITDQKLNEKYSELSNDIAGKKEYQISHIVTKTKEEADKLAKELKSKKFSDLAKKYSVDQESAEKGGDLGYLLESNIIPELSKTVIELKKGDVSAPVQTKFGWHLVKVSDIREAIALPFENVKETIRNQLVQDKINELNTRITKNSEVEIVIELKEEKAPTEPKAEEKSDLEKSDSLPAAEAKEEAPAASEEVKEKTEEKSDDKKTQKHKK